MKADKVYIVTTYDNLTETEHIEAVFSSKTEAEKCKKHHERYYWSCVHEFQIKDRWEEPAEEEKA